MKTKEIDLNLIRTITIPETWQGKAYLISSPDTILVKKIQPISLVELRRRLRMSEIKITEAGIDQEVQNYRKNQ